MAAITHKDGTAAAILNGKAVKETENLAIRAEKIADIALDRVKALEERVGPSGSSDKYFEFTQSVPASTWNINHGLHKKPSVTVTDSSGALVEGDCVYTDENNVVLTFSGEFSGKAFLN